MAILFDARLNTGSTWTRSAGNYSNGTDIMSINQEVTRFDAYGQVEDATNRLVWSINSSASDLVGDKLRNELSAPNSGVNSPGPPRDNSGTYMAKLTNLWRRWNFKLDRNWWFARNATGTDGDCVIIQLHDAPGTSDRVAPWHMLVINDEWQIRNSFSQSVEYDRILYRAPAVRNRWVSVVLNAFWDDTAPETGYMRIWINRRKVFTEDNHLNTYATFNSPGPWPKDVGIYWPHGLPDGWQPSSLLSEGMVVGDGYASFNDFMSAAGIAETELESVTRTPVSAQ